MNSKYKTADWDLIKVMDSSASSSSFAGSQGFFPPCTSQLTGGAYAGDPLMAGFAKQARHTLPICVTCFFNRGGADWGAIVAASVLYTIPPACFFLLVQRHLARGLLAGAVKG